jgi:hypothetical protein
MSFLEQAKDFHSHVEKCVGAMEHGQVMLLGMVFHQCPCDHGVGVYHFILPLAAFSSGP